MHSRKCYVYVQKENIYYSKIRMTSSNFSQTDFNVNQFYQYRFHFKRMGLGCNHSREFGDGLYLWLLIVRHYNASILNYAIDFDIYLFILLGTSDPYLKCVQGSDKLFQTLEKKKTVNPMWAETFVTHVDNPFKPITFQVRNPLFKRTLISKDRFSRSKSLKDFSKNL